MFLLPELHEVAAQPTICEALLPAKRFFSAWVGEWSPTADNFYAFFGSGYIISVYDSICPDLLPVSGYNN